jgi:glycosyltransferase involved in cell wall biosynthesis
MASLEDQFEREKLSLLAFRFAAGSNSISHRVAQIFDTLGITYSWQPTPKVSVITPSCRPEKIDNVVANFLRQTYEPLELLLVINCSLSEIERKTIESRLARSGIRGYRLFFLDGERFTGDAMNIGVWNAEGRYCAKFDDDDSYGPNYVRDLVLSAETVSADLAGKPISFRVVGYEDDDRVHIVKRGKKPYRTVVPWMDHRFATPEWIMGNSIFATRDLLLRVGFPERAYRCSDSGFFFRPELAESRILVSDFFNLVVRRRSDKDSHTWRISDAELLEGATTRNIDEVFV